MKEQSIESLVKDVTRGAVKATELVENSFDQINRWEPECQALLRSHQEKAEAQAAAIDALTPAQREELPLAGLPVVIKDNIAVEGEPLTCASYILENYRADYNALVVERLKQAGAIIIAQSNMDEFAMGSSTENSAFQVTKNPWDLTRVPGGSSGGSAVSVATGYTLCALGSDTGGSIRQPASYCGVTGFKPSYGTISRYGLVAFASSFDQIGPFTRTAEDAAKIMQVLVGRDARDSTSQQHPWDFTLSCEVAPPVRKVRYPISFIEQLGKAERESFEAVVQVLEAHGVVVEPVVSELWTHALAMYYILAPAEASSNLARFDGVRYGNRQEESEDSLVKMVTRTRSQGFGPEVQRRILLGNFTLSAGYADKYFQHAQKVRNKLKQELDRVFEGCDLVLMPTTPQVAFKIGEKTADPMTMYLADIYTVVANLIGAAAISIPGPSVGGLPFGVQLMAGQFQDQAVLETAHWLQQVTDFHRSSPAEL